MGAQPGLQRRQPQQARARGRHEAPRGARAVRAARDGLRRRRRVVQPARAAGLGPRLRAAAGAERADHPDVAPRSRQRRAVGALRRLRVDHRGDGRPAGAVRLRRRRADPADAQHRRPAGRSERRGGAGDGPVRPRGHGPGAAHRGRAPGGRHPADRRGAHGLRHERARARAARQRRSDGGAERLLPVRRRRPLGRGLRGDRRRVGGAGRRHRPGRARDRPALRDTRGPGRARRRGGGGRRGLDVAALAA